jgi:hypothetical protein
MNHDLTKDVQNYYIKEMSHIAVVTTSKLMKWRLFEQCKA